MGQLADRLAFLARRYGSDAAAWQHELHALAALEGSDPKEALVRFHALKRRFAEFRRSQLLDALRAHPFVADLPGHDTHGYPMGEIEADIRQATRALAHAREIERALAEETQLREGLRHRAPPPAPPGSAAARWDALAPLAADAERRRRETAREARLDRRLQDAARRAAKLRDRAPELPARDLAPEALDRALDACDEALRAAETLQEAHDAAVGPLRAPEVATWRGETRRTLEREAARLATAGDAEGLRALAARSEALRAEAAALASQAARSRRKGTAPPARERKSSDPMDGYG